MPQKLNLASLMLFAWSLILPPPLFADPGKPSSDALVGMPSYLSVALSLNKYSDVDEKDARAALNVWISMITKTGGIPTKVDLFSYRDLASFESKVLENKVDLVFFFATEYLEVKNRMPFEPLAVSLPLGAEHKQFSVLVRKDRGISKVGELANSEILIEQGENSVLLSLWLETLLMKEGFPGPAGFFAKFRNVKKSSQALLPVFFKNSDACAVSRGGFEMMKELNPQVGQELVAIAQSPGYPQGIVCVRKGFAEKYPGFVKHMFLVHNLSEGRQILTLMKINKLVPYEPAYLKTTEALLQEHEALKLKLAKKN
jgi:ABC-type phosphate/phosphonate transport system substrate-binding protein